MRKAASFLFVCSSVVLVLTGCGGGTTADDAGNDLGTEAGGHDAGPPDLGGDAGPCRSDPDCADGVYCNGVEGCSPGVAGADARGCVPASSPCLAGQMCDESMRRCTSTSCTGAAADADADGHRSSSCGGDDCDDADPNRYPGNHEVCDATNHDEDCDPATYGFRDNDGDSFPDARCCNASATGVLACGVDCNDDNPSVHPSATETCNGFDDNCNGMTDEGVLHTYSADTDGDGYGTMDATMVMTGCTPPLHYVENATDCNDTTSVVSPAAPELCDSAMVDENCNGMHNEGCSCTTGDSRACSMSAGVCLAGMQDCVAGTWAACSISPVPETCNGLDDDCNGVVDNGVQVTCYVDADDDGFAAGGAALVLECADPARMATRGGCRVGTTNQRPVDATTTDCNDGIAAVYPSAPEVCNGRDDNCNGTTDEGVTMTFYADCDADGHGTSATSGLSVCGTPRTAAACSAPAGYVVSNDDCDDGRTNVFPGRTEDCDCIDNNCNGGVDEMTTPVTTYRDGDGDSYVDMTMSMTTCCPAVGYIQNPHATPALWDCDDTMATIHPGAAQLCGTVDTDCNPATMGTTPTWYADCDRDGYAAMGAASMMTCTMPSGAPGGCATGTWEASNPPTAGLVDCDDTLGGVHPFATEVCDGLDDNCFKEPGHPNFGLGAVGEDNDDDGEAHCTGLMPSDCNDANAAVHHGAVEVPGDNLDEDCDLNELCYADADFDGFRSTGLAAPPTTDIYCTSAGHAPAASGLDCCDNSNVVNPLQTGWFNVVDACGSFDYDCSGSNEREYPDMYTAGTCLDDAGACAGTFVPGWSAAAPACGASASFRQCGTHFICPPSCAPDCCASVCGPGTISVTRVAYCH